MIKCEYFLYYHPFITDHRIIESLRVEKTSKIIKSERQPTMTMPAKQCPESPGWQFSEMS